MTLPLHFLKRFVEPRGIRLPKRSDPVEVAGVCPICKLSVLRKKLLCETQLQGVIQNGVYYHTVCAPKSNLYSEVRPAPAIVQVVENVKGNLQMEEYKYWIGYRAKPMDSKWAMCRCCRTMTYGVSDRKEHFRNTKYALDGDQCSTRLVRAYKILLTQDVCLVCKKPRYDGEKWGVPLCHSILCHTNWMFDAGTKYIQLYTQLKLQEKKSDFLSRQKAEIEEAKRSRPYCQECKMFADNPVHDQLHQGDKMFIKCTSVDSKTGITKELVWCNMCKMHTDNINHGPVHNAMARGGTFVGEA